MTQRGEVGKAAQRPTGPAEPEPERDRGDTENHCGLRSGEPIPDREAEGLLVNGSETAPRGGQVQPAGNQFRVGLLARFSALRHDGRIGDPDGQCLPTPVSSLAVEQGPLGDAEQPSPRIPGIGRQVVESTPGHQEYVGHNVLCVRWVDAPLHEPDEVCVRRLVHRAERRFAIWRRSRNSGTHPHTSELLIPMNVRHARQCVWILQEPGLVFPQSPGLCTLIPTPPCCQASLGRTPGWPNKRRRSGRDGRVSLVRRPGTEVEADDQHPQLPPRVLHTAASVNWESAWIR